MTVLAEGDALELAVVWWLVSDAVAFGLLALAIVWTLRVLTGRVHTQVVLALKEQADRVIAEVRSVREKQSRHEYRHALQLSELRRELADVRSDTEYVAGRQERVGTTPSESLRVLMVTSNGAGLGHLTRCLALAAEFPLGWSVDILTLSTGWRRVDPGAAALHYFPSKDRLGLPQPEWHRRFARAFAALADDLKPDVIFFDGTVVYRGVHETARQRSIPFIWIVRGGWKAGIATEQTKSPERIADGVLLPADFAIGEEQAPVSTDRVAVLRTPPLVYAPSVLDGRAAREALGLAERERHVLVQLGAGNIDDIGDKLLAVVAAIERLGGNWRAVVVDSPITGQLAELPEHVSRIAAYPLSRYYRAFEFVVVAAGYNTVQEVIALRVPAVLVPNHETLTDDQGGRAAAAADRGLVLSASTLEQIATGVEALARDDQRATLLAALEGLGLERHAIEIAPWVEDVIAQAALTSRVTVAKSANLKLAETVAADAPTTETER
ncbi:glycosyltransferase [Agrococcus sp. ARC_14]|uniref:glycosyltransferase n=1 Tax=Agrococcus sp. ARC_14 TaxID=2919927 RepID=UPI001F065A0A|nr:hypothetical protein [Agrococcus sp. ARC_14]